MDWGEFSQPESKPWSMKTANKFLLCCFLDYQIPSDVAWRNGYRLIEDILGDPDDVWRAITSISDSEWKLKRDAYKLHRFPAAHERLWRIGRRICDEYDGDARRIWEGRDPRSVLETLWALCAGDQISRMIVGALRDCGEIRGAASDVKGDVYVCRVLGRAMRGKPTDPETAVRLAAQLHPADPWRLDAQLWYIGKTYCYASSPDCSRCYLAPHCAYALSGRRAEGGRTSGVKWDAQVSMKKICRYCGEPFIPQVGKPGYVDECPECKRTLYEKPIPVGGGRATTSGYQFALQTMDGRNVLVDGNATFSYNEVEDYGQLALVSLSLGMLCSVAKTDGYTKTDGEWKAGRKWKVPTPHAARVAGLIEEAKAHSFALV